jgi:hypothetical protein
MIGTWLVAHDTTNARRGWGGEVNLLARRRLLVAERATNGMPMPPRFNFEQPAAGSTAKQVPTGKVRVVGTRLVTYDARDGARRRPSFPHRTSEPNSDVPVVISLRDVEGEHILGINHPQCIRPLLTDEVEHFERNCATSLDCNVQQRKLRPAVPLPGRLLSDRLRPLVVNKLEQFQRFLVSDRHVQQRN